MEVRSTIFVPALSLTLRTENAVDIAQLSTNKTIILTHVCDDMITDYAFENPQVETCEGGLTITSASEPTTSGIFGLVDWMYPEADTMMELIGHYDGEIFAYGGNMELLNVSRKVKILPEEEQELKASEAFVITAY